MVDESWSFDFMGSEQSHVISDRLLQHHFSMILSPHGVLRLIDLLERSVRVKADPPDQQALLKQLLDTGRLTLTLAWLNSELQLQLYMMALSSLRTLDQL